MVHLTYRSFSALQHAMAILAFRADTQCPAYKELFAESQWKLLEELFYQELYRLNNLTSESLLAIHLQVRAVCNAVYIQQAGNLVLQESTTSQTM